MDEAAVRAGVVGVVGCVCLRFFACWLVMPYLALAGAFSFERREGPLVGLIGFSNSRCWSRTSSSWLLVFWNKSTSMFCGGSMDGVALDGA